MRNRLSIALIAVLLAIFISSSGCSSSPNDKNNIRQYPQNRPATWEKNNNMPSMSF